MLSGATGIGHEIAYIPEPLYATGAWRRLNTETHSAISHSSETAAESRVELYACQMAGVIRQKYDRCKFCAEGSYSGAPIGMERAATLKLRFP